MNQNKIGSLYELIKQKSQAKGRPLKIIADWDECLFAFQPFAISKFLSAGSDFKEFFAEFWENTTLQLGENEDPSNPSANKKFVYNGTGKGKKAYEKFKKLLKEREEDTDKNSSKYEIVNVQSHSPFLSTAEDIIRCLKEDLISDLIVITTTRNSEKGKKSMVVVEKEKRFSKNFGKFLQSKLGVMMVEKINGQNKPHHWEWIKDNYPDFDIFIDDDPDWIKSVQEHFPDRIFVINDYKCNKNTTGDNIYRLKTTVSDLKDEDFAKAAEEYKNKILKNEKKFDGKSIWLWIAGATLILGLIIAMIYVVKKTKKKK